MIGPATIGCTVWAALPSASSTPCPMTRVGTEPNIPQIRPAATMTVSDSHHHAHCRRNEVDALIEMVGRRETLGRFPQSVTHSSPR